MLSREVFSEDYIHNLQIKTGNDPVLLERVIYAFGLLEALIRVHLPFCFKGGTSLLLLLEHPQRLSTDVDIVVPPGTDIEAFVEKAGRIFPFLEVDENIRVGKNGIEKRHFKFSYCSPLNQRIVTILLDVLFEELPYCFTEKRPLRNELLKTEGEDYLVQVPDVNGLLGEKLTAFAPHTTGILFGAGKELEIIKQLYDCSSLIDVMSDFKQVKSTYEHVAKAELRYRGLSMDIKDVLKDTIEGCLCIISRGIPEGDYRLYKDGISRIRGHIFGRKFSGEIAGACACRVLYLAAAILIGQDFFKRIEDSTVYRERKPHFEKSRRFSYLQVVDPIVYGYLIEASLLLESLVLR